MPNQHPIPTQLNIAPRGKSWKNWQLVDDPAGFPTREAMEKYHCNPERVRELEECRERNLETIDRLNDLLNAAQQCVQPVAGQSRMFGGEWGSCSVEHVAMVLAAPHEWKDYEARYLYAHPTPQGLDAHRAIKSAADKLDAAKRCHPAAVHTLIDEALEILDTRLAAQAKRGGM